MNKFYQLSPIERLLSLKENNHISTVQLDLLKNTLNKKQLDVCNQLSENVVSGLYLPLSIVPDVCIDNIKYQVPMTTEESSVVAAINKINKMIINSGTITTESSGNIGIGQMHLPKLKKPENFINKVIHNKEKWQNIAHESCLKSMVSRGGGIVEIEPKILGDIGLIHFHVDTCDAMGANIINQMLEMLAEYVANDLEEEIGIKILSNFTDRSLTKAQLKVKIPKAQAEKIIQANNLAKIDKYRACTHNKGIMNGICAILLATGNDYRAVSAAVHTFAAENGYSSLTEWWYSNGLLNGNITIPINIGILGGMTKVHPITKCCLEVLKVKNAAELARICAAIGLMQNLAALLALTSEGICKGHMALHVNNILSELSLSKKEHDVLKNVLLEMVNSGLCISTSEAQKALARIRENL